MKLLSFQRVPGDHNVIGRRIGAGRRNHPVPYPERMKIGIIRLPPIATIVNRAFCARSTSVARGHRVQRLARGKAIPRTCASRSLNREGAGCL